MIKLYGLFRKKVKLLPVCSLFVIKKTNIGKTLLPDNDEIPPYEGAKPCILIENLNDKALLKEVIQKTYNELPEPKPKKKKLKE